MQPLGITLAILALVLVVWSAWGYFSSRVEQARYTALKAAKGYELREYAPQILAQTTVQGQYEEALSEGFRIVAGYIFGGNTKEEKIAMTAPVREAAPSEKIAMTAPVTTNVEGDTHTISFVMPAKYTLATLPVPTDSRVKLVEVPAQKMAVRSFGWPRTEARLKAAEESLRADLTRDGLTAIGEPVYAGYNAPWTPPWLIRNEVLIPVR